MGLVTLQVLDGAERGRVFRNLPTPVTIGREEENAVRLNDERVSRFHAKIQEDGGRAILTDLDSTNGTRVNGHAVHLRVLQPGDQVALGRSVLVFGSREEIAERLRKRPRGQRPSPPTYEPTIAGGSSGDLSSAPDVDPDAGSGSGIEIQECEELFPYGPPELPSQLRAVQQAQLSDLLAYIHDQVAAIIDAAEAQNDADFAPMHVDWVTWQRLLHLEMILARQMRDIAGQGDE